ncbi:MAG: PDC sensor domain-containing protein [Kangiellaceae bacterium]|nr:PDC sensor domain-containing protein [Kangiellaceae bacterium]
MSKLLPLSLLIVISLFLLCFNVHSESRKPSQAYIDQLVQMHEKLVGDIASNSSIIKYLSEHNANKTSLADIMKKEDRWLVSKRLQEEVTNNKVAKQLSKILADPNYSIVEIIITDSLGGTVAASPAPSDYWQGDEEKFIQPVKQENIYISDSKWDESSEAYSFFMAKPIYVDAELLGVMMVGVDVTVEYLMRIPIEELIKLRVEDTPNID